MQTNLRNILNPSSTKLQFKNQSPTHDKKYLSDNPNPAFTKTPLYKQHQAIEQQHMDKILVTLTLSLKICTLALLQTINPKILLTSNTTKLNYLNQFVKLYVIHSFVCFLHSQVFPSSHSTYTNLSIKARIVFTLHIDMLWSSQHLHTQLYYRSCSNHSTYFTPFSYTISYFCRLKVGPFTLQEVTEEHVLPG